MAEHSFTKLFSTITDSTIWAEPDHIRILWVTMLAMTDRNGKVSASVPGLANRARITVEQCEEGLGKFQSPDRYSRTKAHEGRRVQEVEGGWVLLNHSAYRQLTSDENRREYQREWVKEKRTGAKGKSAAGERAGEGGDDDPLAGATEEERAEVERQMAEAKVARAGQS